MIETLSTYTAQKPFTDRIDSRGLVGRFKYLDAARCGHASEIGSKLVITITDEILRARTISDGFSNMLCRPSVSGRSRDADVNHSARVQLDNEEGEQRVEEEISDWEKVAGPADLGLSV